MMRFALAVGVLLAQTQPAVNAASTDEAKAYVDHMTVRVGSPFWLYLEATGESREFPDPLRLDGFVVDPINQRRTTSVNNGGAQGSATEKRGYYVRARVAGLLTIPPMTVIVDGRAVLTNSVDIRAVPRLPETPPEEEGEERAVPHDDIVFLRLHTDRQRAYQGEGILLTRQLWHILDPRIESGPYREELNTLPTTEGFVSNEFEPRAYVADEGDYTYEVLEDRMILYPTQTSRLSVGQWHWEGIALIRRPHAARREKVYYELNAGPIEVDVTPLPRAPKGFSGAVGTFTLDTVFKGDSYRQGVPVTLEVSLAGMGNPDALGEPVLPEMPWAHVSEPDRVLEVELDEQKGVIRVTKRLSYTVTPLRSGQVEIPPIEFVYFDPAQGAYQALGSAPLTIEVEPTHDERRLVVTEELDLNERDIEILGQDIRPLQENHGPLHREKGGALPLTAAVVFAPVVVYGLASLAVRRRGSTTATLLHRPAPGSIAAALAEDEPADGLFRFMSHALSERFGLVRPGISAEDAYQAIRDGGISEDSALRWRALFTTLERQRYGKHTFSAAGLAELESEANACLDALSDGPQGRRN